MDFLYKYFSEVIKVNTNPYTLIVNKTFKENEKIQTISIKKEIHLSDTTKSKFVEDLLSITLDKSEIKEFEFFPKNIIQRIFRKKNIELTKEINSLTENNYIITSEEISNKIEFNCQKEILCGSKAFEKIILVGKKSSTIYLKTKNDEDFEFSIDITDFKIFLLK